MFVICVICVICVVCLGLTSFEVLLKETSSALREVLECDNDMNEMYLSLKMKTGTVPTQHDEIEVILETYLRKVDELENEVTNHIHNIGLFEEHIQLRLDTARNAIMKMELFLSVLTFGVTCGALVAGIFGMNLFNHLETTQNTFLIVTAIIVFVCAMVMRGMVRLLKTKKIEFFTRTPEEPKLHLPVNGKKRKTTKYPPH